MEWLMETGVHMFGTFLPAIAAVLIAMAAIAVTVTLGKILQRVWPSAFNYYISAVVLLFVLVSVARDNRKPHAF
jgi:hypothetical protein